jgi:glycosyltransferase involved in cell wall biosynthesis
MVAAESLLCETPVVATRSGGLPDIVRDGDSGTLVSSYDDPAIWSAAVRAIVMDPERRAAMGSAGRAHMLTLVSPEAVAERYRSVYEQARRGIVRAR